MSRRDRRGDENPLATYLYIGAVMGAIVGGLAGLVKYDQASALFHGGCIGMVAGAIVAVLITIGSSN